MKGRKQATGSQRIRFYVKRDALQRSWVKVLKIFIQNWALLAHIHLHLLGASFTKLKQGPYLVEKPESLRHALIFIGFTYYKHKVIKFALANSYDYPHKNYIVNIFLSLRILNPITHRKFSKISLFSKKIDIYSDLI